MILTFLIFLLTALLKAMLAVLPSGHLSSVFGSSMHTIATYTWGWNKYFPIDTLYAAFASVIAFEIAVFTFRLIFWVYHKFWGHSTA